MEECDLFNALNICQNGASCVLFEGDMSYAYCDCDSPYFRLDCGGELSKSIKVHYELILLNASCSEACASGDHLFKGEP